MICLLLVKVSCSLSLSTDPRHSTRSTEYSSPRSPYAAQTILGKQVMNRLRRKQNYPCLPINLCSIINIYLNSYSWSHCVVLYLNISEDFGSKQMTRCSIILSSQKSKPKGLFKSNTYLTRLKTPSRVFLFSADTALFTHT